MRNQAAKILTVALVAVAMTTLSSPSGATAARSSDGTYQGRAIGVGSSAFDQALIRFRVARRGTRITNWKVWMNVVCSTYPVSVEFIAQPMPPMAINRRGWFRRVFRRNVNGTTARIAVSGRLVGRQVRHGRLSYRVGLCGRGEGRTPIRWTARRR